MRKAFLIMASDAAEGLVRWAQGRKSTMLIGDDVCMAAGACTDSEFNLWSCAEQCWSGFRMLDAANPLWFDSGQTMA